MKKDEELTLAYTLGGYADTTKFLLALTIYWKQWNIDNNEDSFVPIDNSFRFTLEIE
ncbi:hypothetical protein [Paenibacillus solani]|uniref:hypothetical protein n=1 Tax=Paenibacillus solani TaxID=1705565 RepID=UPI000A539027|nr:hypothetical protein [Paenibacillus solani]